MSVALFRIDYRLLHWQTGVLWAKKLNADTILVAGDAVAGNDMRRKLVLFSAPADVDTRVLSLAETAAYLNSPEAAPHTVELLVESTDDALALVQQVPALRSVNAALMKTLPSKKLLTKYLAADAHDLDNFRAMLALGARVECYTVPTETPVSIEKYL